MSLKTSVTREPADLKSGWRTTAQRKVHGTQFQNSVRLINVQAARLDPIGALRHQQRRQNFILNSFRE
ncbi:hypothetical protein [Denitratisoma sp. DHT3]|uniref:hypothetical protein n=1 Tax=Denitratisoma sp. DHT3 TaxID=1981880 RepID=UPI0011A9884E|nr:hypothetical protein [Denitratisoma sp. DHT3]